MLLPIITLGIWKLCSETSRKRMEEIELVVTSRSSTLTPAVRELGLLSRVSFVLTFNGTLEDYARSEAVYGHF
jgi:hypothetical protein